MSEKAFRATVQAESGDYLRLLEGLEARRGGDAVEFAAHYRLLCRRLALARRRGYGADLVEWLNQLALRGHAQLYKPAPPGWGSAHLMDLVWKFPRALRAEWRSQLAALALFLVPALGAWLALHVDGDLATYFIDAEQLAEMEAMYDPASPTFLHPRESGDDVQMFGFYIFNNIGIAFRAFASGLLFGAGSVFFTAYNGLVLGAVAGHLTAIGSGVTFFPFVIGHGAFELPALVMAGGAGLKVGFSLLSPGPWPRSVALRRSARACLPIVYGFVAMLLIAAFLEAFWSSQHSLGNTLRYVVGGGLWALVISLWIWGGRGGAARVG